MSVAISDFKAEYVVFRDGGRNGRDIVVGLNDMDSLEFMKRFPDATRADAVELDGTAEKFFLVAVADCFDPPLTVVRAKREDDAEEGFADSDVGYNLCKIEERDMEDFSEDSLYYNSSGKPYDSEGIVIYPLKLVSIHFTL